MDLIAAPAKASQMSHPAILRAALSGVAALGAIMSASAHAAESNVQFWGYGTVAYDVDERTDIRLEVSPRFRAEEAGRDRVETTLVVGHDLSDTVAVGGGVGYVEFSGRREARLIQDVTFSAGQLDFRTRLEERIFADADRLAIRAQQRARLTVPLGDATDLSGSGELYYIVQAPDRGDGSRVDSWRARLHLQHRLSDKWQVGAAYMLMLEPRDDQPDRLSHIPQLTLTFRP